MWIPILALQAPGPRVTMHTPRAAGKLSVGFGHHRRAVFVAAGDDADLLTYIVQGIQNRQIALARHTENGVDPELSQGVYDDFAAGSFLVPPLHLSPRRPSVICHSVSESTS